MREIEVKAKLGDKGSVVKKLEESGCVFGEVVTQEDVVYVKNVGNLETFIANNVFLRIRTNNGTKVIFTLKKRLGQLNSIEHEVEVSSKKEIEEILSLIDYKVAMRINKIRRKTQYNGCEICIDEVEDLGSFIEMEKLGEDLEVEKVQDELFEFLLTLGVRTEDRVRNGYDILMFEKMEGRVTPNHL